MSKFILADTKGESAWVIEADITEEQLKSTLAAGWSIKQLITPPVTPPITKTRISKFRRWLVESKVTLQRGYGWTQVPLLGVIAAGTLKAAFPGLIDGFWKFALLSIIGLLTLYFIGWLDRRYRFFHEESNYNIEVSPLLMKIVNAVEEKNNNTK